MKVLKIIYYVVKIKKTPYLLDLQTEIFIHKINDIWDMLQDTLKWGGKYVRIFMIIQDYS